ncbi:ABC transporter permease [Mobilicoccus massiliensis]|uniref:ABC transporter permease n=1 Tax=Mobilicoccus massiliensis TaxID=1522310 RepID=UPI00059041F4|nr:ABC transporter permease [Mobilicoccus massiliensis]
MNALVRNEYAKMRRLHVVPVMALLMVGTSGLTMFYALLSGLLDHAASPDGHGWKMLFAGFGMAMSLAAPVLLAVIASRQVEVEHLGNGWLASSTSGHTPGRVCRAKFVSLALPVVAVTVMSGLLVVAFGTVMGVTAPVPGARWMAYVAALVVVNLAVLAFHVLLSAKVENQLVCIGVGVIGIFLAVFGQLFPAWLAHLLPWGHYPLTTQADFVGEQLVYFDPPGASVVVLALAGTALFWFVTDRFDRQEA